MHKKYGNKYKIWCDYALIFQTMTTTSTVPVVGK